jgi:purine-nucleoside phosphorylase
MSEAADYINGKTPIRPKVGVVLGSGLGAFAESLVHAIRVRYAQLPGFPVSTAVGHAGELVIGTLGANGKQAVDLAVMSGRFHLYEGYPPQQVTAGIRLFHELGIKRVVLTNAAGGINPDYGEGALVLISDHINLQGTNPLVGPAQDLPRFIDMTEAYSPALRKLAQEAADELGMTVYEGVYAAMLGPSYETPAEIRFLKTIGADLVGMSTVLETITANQLGMEVLGISCVTNLAAGISGNKLSHQEVLDIGKQISGKFLRLLGHVLPAIAGE